MLIHVHWARVSAVRITAGGIVPHSSRARCKPDLERVKEDPVGIIRIDGDALVVPVLRIITGAVTAISGLATLIAFHITPARATVCGSPSADLAARGVAATTIIVTDNGLYLGVDVIRVTRRDSNVDSTQLIAGVDVNKRRPAAGIHRCSGRIGAAADLIAEDEPVCIAGD